MVCTIYVQSFRKPQDSPPFFQQCTRKYNGTKPLLQENWLWLCGDVLHFSSLLPLYEAAKTQAT